MVVLELVHLMQVALQEIVDFVQMLLDKHVLNVSQSSIISKVVVFLVIILVENAIIHLKMFSNILLFHI